MFEMFDEEGKVICQFCGEPSGSIPLHLRWKHPDLSTAEYKEMYPDCPVFPKNRNERRKKTIEEKTVENEPKDNSNETTENKVNYIVEETIVTKEINEKIEKETDRIKEIKDEKLSIELSSQKKEDFINFLRNYFDFVTENEFISKINRAGMLEYEIITDITCVKDQKKYDIEVINAFWHNYDVVEPSGRDNKISASGRIIVKIENQNPTVYDLKNKLEELNII